MKKINEDEYEEEFFKDDNQKSYIIKIAVGAAVLLIAIIVLIVLVFAGKKNKSKDDELQQNIISYAEEIPNESDDDKIIINDRNDDKTENTENSEEQESIATPTPSATPFEDEIADDDGEVMEKGKKDYKKIKFDTKRNLSEMEGYFVEGNEQAIWDLAHLDRYIAMSYSFSGTTDYAYYGDVNSNGKPNGKGIAVYADNQYYYGDWVNGVRQGGGRWIHFHIHNVDNHKDAVSLHQYFGGFYNDLPEGEGQEHYEFINELMEDGKIYINNYMTTYKEGKMNGPVYATSLTKSEKNSDWEGEAKDGSFIYLSESRDSLRQGPAMINRENPDEYYWVAEKDNKNLGVKSYISSNKQ